MTNIDFSIIIPHYHTPNLLARCLRSIPENNFIQVIVVDDNSPQNDYYREIIPELSRKNVEFYVTKEGKGAGKARNIGLKYVKGRWVLFADADDFFVEDFWEILSKYKNAKEEIVYFNIKSCYSDDISKLYRDTKEHLFNIYKKTGNDLVFRLGYTEPWGKLIKRDLIVDNKIQFQETKANNDFLFSVKIGLSAKNIKIVNRPLYWYVFREGSLSNSKGAEPISKSRDRLIAFSEVDKLLHLYNIKTKVYLPSIPARYFFYHNIRGFCYSIPFMKSIGLNVPLLLFEIVIYILKRLLHLRQYEIYECFIYNK